MALYNAFPLNMANAASRPANQPRQGSGLRNTTRLLAGLLTAGSASAWAAGPSVDLEASVSQQFPNDQMRVQLVKESRGHTIETLNAQVIEAINQALEKARTAPTVKAYANGINTHQEWNKNGEPDGWEVRGSLVLEGSRRPPGRSAGQHTAARWRELPAQHRTPPGRRKQSDPAGGERLPGTRQRHSHRLRLQGL